MARLFRFLGAADSPDSTAIDCSEPVTVDSGFIVICVLGLATVARCSWHRRSSSSVAAASDWAQAPPFKANKGLKKILRSLPKLTCTPESAATYSDCAICLAEFSAGEEIRVLPHCGHAFHVACIDKWLVIGSRRSCPSCRRILVSSGSGRCEKWALASL